MTKIIAVLTQPLINNYGGLLQAYALKEVLKGMGHEVVIINRQYKTSFPLRKYAAYMKRRLLGQIIPPNYFISKSLREEISENTRLFREKYIPNLSELITTHEGMSKVRNMGFDVLVVGSDQCWRPKYSPGISNYFFDFAKDDKHIKRISYAASFGVSDWEFTDEESKTAKDLIQLFDAISVREDSAVDLVRDYLGRDDAIHVLDPTMLLSADQYKQIAQNENMPKSPGELKMYILDHTKEKDQVVNTISDKLGLKSFEVYPKKRMGSEKATPDNIADFTFPSPAAWLRGFQDAKFVVADSFHGIVFSILFNVPFLAIGNKERGMTRFTSLLKMFELEDRLVTDIASLSVDDFLKKQIDWDKVNTIVEVERVRAKDFLTKNI